MTDDSKSRRISWVALFVSVVSPFVVYHCLQNEVRLQQIKSKAIRGLYTFSSSFDDTSDEATTVYAIEIKNDGELPVGSVELLLECGAPNYYDGLKIDVNPFRRVTKSREGNRLIIAFDGLLPPREEVRVILTKTIKSTNGGIPASPNVNMWIRSEASPTIPLDRYLTSLGFADIL